MWKFGLGILVVALGLALWVGRWTKDMPSSFGLRGTSLLKVPDGKGGETWYVGGSDKPWPEKWSRHVRIRSAWVSLWGDRVLRRRLWLLGDPNDPHTKANPQAELEEPATLAEVTRTLRSMRNDPQIEPHIRPFVDGPSIAIDTSLRHQMQRLPIIVASTVFAATLTAPFVRRWSRRRRGLCADCGYPITSSLPRCSECGREHP